MFNGVAIEFDKLNPKISSSERVPMLGELMTSRWAFEAIMVRQFKDNDYEKHFYEYDKTIADANYKTTYYLKELETNLASCGAALRGTASRDEISDHLDLIKYELKKELKNFDKQDSVDWEKLVPDKFDSLTSKTIEEHIATLKRIYINRKNEALDQIESLKKVIRDKNLEEEYFHLKNSYTNEKVASIVKNQGFEFIKEVGNRLIRKTTPIYATPEIPENPLNFRTFYYAPQKYFAGRYFDTFWFNVAIIWVMSIIALIALYLDLLKKIFNLFERIGDYKLRQKLKKDQLPIRK